MQTQNFQYHSTVSMMASTNLPYVGQYIYIRQLGCTGHQAFVSKLSTDGSDSWFQLVDNFGPEGRWSRAGWEVAAIKDSTDSDRRGFYVNAKNATVYITVRSLDDIEVVSVRQP